MSSVDANISFKIQTIRHFLICNVFLFVVCWINDKSIVQG